MPELIRPPQVPGDHFVIKPEPIEEETKRQPEFSSESDSEMSDFEKQSFFTGVSSKVEETLSKSSRKI